MALVALSCLRQLEQLLLQRLMQRRKSIAAKATPWHLPQEVVLLWLVLVLQPSLHGQTDLKMSEVAFASVVAAGAVVAPGVAIASEAAIAAASGIPFALVPELEVAFASAEAAFVASADSASAEIAGHSAGPAKRNLISFACWALGMVQPMSVHDLAMSAF